MSSLEAGSQFLSAASAGSTSYPPMGAASSKKARQHGLRAGSEATGSCLRFFVDVRKICRSGSEPSALGRYAEAVGYANPRYDELKRILDLVLAIAGLVLTAPFWTLVVIAIRLESSGGGLFRQQRVGRNGRTFTMYKFRSMYENAPQYELSPKSAKDSRITRIGRLLRRTSLDELPQLLNVVKGEMSLVGPRPEMPFVVGQNRAAHEQRLRVAPGMTGLWQLSPARAARIHENLQYDHFYVQNRSLAMDLAILLYTPVFLMRGV